MPEAQTDRSATIGLLRRVASPAVLLWIVSIGLTAGALVCAGLILATPGAWAAAGGIDVYSASFLILGPVYATVGAVIVSRGSGNRVGWIISGIGLFLAGQNFVGAYGALAGTSAGNSLPGATWMMWLGGWLWVPAVVGALALLPIHFPNGRIPSRRWRPLVWGIWGVAGLAVLGVMFTPSSPADAAQGAINPVGLSFLAPVSDITHALYVLVVLVGVISGAASLVIRYRRGSPDERHQVKWFAGAFGLVALVLAAYAVVNALNVPKPDWLIAAILVLGLSVIPISVAIAVLKYRLYDIDVVISRALVYGLLAAFITAVYVAIVVGVGTLVGSGGQPNLVLSIIATAVVAVAFQPVRGRLQKVANRLVYGNRATPYEVLSQFSERVAETYAADEALPRMARVLAEGTGAARAQVWLRAGGTLRPAASWPETDIGSVPVEPVLVQEQELPTLPGDLAVAVRHQDELLGALTVTKRQGESLTPIERKLLDDLAHQAGLVLKNVGLTAELLARLDDLRASRQRLVAAQDQERRKLERNLHDGAQQNLVAIKVKLGLAAMVADKDPDKARELVAQLKADTDEALDTLRDLARGIYPPLLADQGLKAALTAQGRKATLPVEVKADTVGRYPQDIEAAVYFCCLEALQNVQKYAGATRATIRLREGDGGLVFEVEDDGAGFDPGTQAKGSGLQNMEDRLDALGGVMELRSLPGQGTTLSASLPLTAPVDPDSRPTAMAVVA